MIQHVPNLLSLGRLVSVPIEVWLILEGEMTWAFWLFVIAGASDGVDGFIARRARGALGGVAQALGGGNAHQDRLSLDEIVERPFGARERRRALDGAQPCAALEAGGRMRRL